MNKYVGIWVNVSFEKGNDFLSYDEDNAGSWIGDSSLPFEEIFKDCYKGERYFKEAAVAAKSLGILKIDYVWLLFHESENDATDARLLSLDDEAIEGVNVTIKGQAAYIGHFLLS
jgi:hypothetical protein